MLFFTNLALIDARYVSSGESAFKNNKVELVPPLNLKTGLTFKRNHLSITYQYSYTDRHYTDATNTAAIDPSAVAGIIPAYYVMDLSAKYNYKWLTFEASVNNLTNNKYFTRRASGYPGPGIIPADARSFYFTLGWKI